MVSPALARCIGHGFLLPGIVCLMLNAGVKGVFAQSTAERCKKISRGLASAASVTPGLVRFKEIAPQRGCKESLHPAGVHLLKVYVPRVAAAARP
jgi:hypothetical protein